MKYLLLVLFFSSGLLLFGQKEKRSTGEYQLNLSRSEMSESQACEYCKEMARVQAIEKVFGSVIIQGNTTTIRNSRTGEEVSTNQVFNMIAETYVNGDWIKTLDEECDRFVEKDEFWVRCKVKGVVQELKGKQVNLQVKPLDCAAENCETFQYKNGEDFFLYLNSPLPGYISVYISDGQIAQRIFPYQNMPEAQINGARIKADQGYILFSKDEDALGLRSYVDELELYTDKPVDQNRIYVIYSEKPLVKPGLSRSQVSDPSYEMPMELSFESFQRWLAQNRRYDSGIYVERVDISISK